MRQARFSFGTTVPIVGQGTWHMGENPAHRSAEVAALRHGVSLGLRLIDTAEMYAEGGAEEIVGEAIAGMRDEVFLVSKITPHNASRAGTIAACERSLKRLKTSRIDLYLLHWPGQIPLSETVAAFETLREAGKIGAWGVSNFDPVDMGELQPIRHGGNCATNQILYNPEHRGVEFDLLGWCAGRDMPVMAYSPLGQGGRLLKSPALRAVASRHAATTAQIALAWALRQPNVIVIPKSATIAHVTENAAAAEIRLTAQDLAEIDKAYPPPRAARPLAML